MKLQKTLLKLAVLNMELRSKFFICRTYIFCNGGEMQILLLSMIINHLNIPVVECTRVLSSSYCSLTANNKKSGWRRNSHEHSVQNISDMFNIKLNINTSLKYSECIHIVKRPWCGTLWTLVFLSLGTLCNVTGRYNIDLGVR